MRIGGTVRHQRAMRREELRVVGKTRSLRPILGVPCLLSRLTEAIPGHPGTGISVLDPRWPSLQRADPPRERPSYRDG
jgi:hypothetical protein